MNIEIIKIPSDVSLLESKNWTRLGNNKFGTIRKIYVIEKKKSNSTLDGPSIGSFKIPKNSEIKFERKQSIVRKNFYEISNSIHTVVTTKLASEVSSNLNSSISVLPIQAQFGSALGSKVSSEFTATMDSELSTTKSYEVISLDEITNSISIKTPVKSIDLIKYHFFLPVWQWEWSIYLFKQESLELTYKKEWLLWQLRKTYNYQSITPKLPLSKLIMFEPQNDFPSLEIDPFKPQIDDTDIIKTVPLNSQISKNNINTGTSLQELAEIAFPVSKEEKRRAEIISSEIKKRRKEEDEDALVKLLPKRGYSGIAKKAAPKKKAAKKAAPKKKAAKKAAKKK